MIKANNCFTSWQTWMTGSRMPIRSVSHLAHCGGEGESLEIS